MQRFLFFLFSQSWVSYFPIFLSNHAAGHPVTTIFDYQACLFSTSYIVHVLTYSHFFEINEFQLIVFFFNRLGKWAYGGS